MEHLKRELLEDYVAYPERVLQFGTGNFLRAFFDYHIHTMNKKNLFNGQVVVVQSTSSGTVKTMNEQDGLYTLYLQGIKDNKPVSEHEVIRSISRGLNLQDEYEEYLKLAQNPDLRFIVSNTTEAGIAFNPDDKLTDQPQKSFPGKLTAFLYKRFQAFSGDLEKGFIIFPCELIENNGVELKRIVNQFAREWQLEEEFIEWVEKANTFCNTLVDRIVPGYPKDSIEEKTAELGYVDQLMVVGEQFELFVIEGPEWIKDEFPAARAGLNVHIVDDLSSYRTKKVRMLNGAHTAMTPVAYLYGLDTVSQAVTNEATKTFIEQVMNDEIIPTLPYAKNELHEYAKDVINRFRNPYIHHYLASISLNSISKFKTRVMPTFLDYEKSYNQLPKGILFSLSALLYFYKGKRGDEEIKLVDDEATLALFQQLWQDESVEIGELVKTVLSKEELWGIDLSYVADVVTGYVTLIHNVGMQEALAEFLQEEGEVNESVY
ncbi:tagaturonate reductase [Bacillus sp. PS06]|uniref:tagaturonate reductase n=1 Tax=Bacillus sp. PS06 TaxID=2764176 RepID=UPI001CD8E24D|nr:tagaturonate reductase [Bacillus sp. PS06]